MQGIVRSRISGAGQIVLATAVGGGSGYLLTLLVAARLGPREYAHFGVFWSFLFFAVSVLGGVQQEFARATSPRNEEPTARARPVVAVCAIAMVVVVVGTSPVWTGLFPGEAYLLVLPVTIGLLGYLVTATLAGVLYGLRVWTVVAAMIAVDGVLRLIATAIVVIFVPSTTVLAWCVIAPFAVVPFVAWLVVRRRVVGAYRIDGTTRTLLSNIGSTVGGSAAMGVLISGYSAALALTSPSVPATELGAIVFAVSLARAPLVIVVLALQSFLVVLFRDSPSWRRLLTGIVAGIVATGVVLAGVAWAVGPPILRLFGEGFVLPAGLLAAVVGSAGLVGALCATGAAAVARSLHREFVIGWIAAAVLAVGVLMHPIPFETRIVVSMASPVLGLFVHAVALAHARQLSSRFGDPERSISN